MNGAAIAAIAAGPARGSRGLAAIALTLVVGLAAAGDRWLDPFVGEWSGEGRFSGNDARYRVSWRPVLGDRFVRLSVRCEWAENGAPRSFEGEALYSAVGAANARGDWFDSEGHRFATSAYRSSDREVVVHWGDARLRGRSTYSLMDGALEVNDAVWSDAGGWRTFAHARLQRQ